MSETRKHHDFSPSSLQCREASPCYHPNDAESEASRLGTKQHKAYETGDLAKLTDEQAAAVETCLNYSDEVKEKMLAKYSPGNVARVLNETYLAVDDEATTAGYIDRAYISPDFTEADLLDCKFGKWDVEPAETNLQGICYALGLRQRYPTLQRIGVHFMMPYLGYVDSFNFVKDFDTLLFRVRAVVLRAKQWKADKDAGKPVKWYPTTGTCLFCGRLGECEAIPGVALKISQKFSPLELPANFTPSLSGDSKDGELRMKLGQLMVTWGQATRRQITAAVIDDRCEVPNGYEIIESQRRDTKDSAKVIEIAREEFGLTQEQIDQASSISLTKLEDAISDNAPRRGKTEAVETFRNRLKTVDALKEGKPYAYLRMIKPDENAADDNDNTNQK